MDAARITALTIYPVKSCRGIAVDRALAGVRGLVAPGAGIGDREWMVVDAADRFLTQRELPRMALIGTALDAATLTLAAPAIAPLAVPTAVASGAVARSVTVWNSVVAAHDEGDAAAGWLHAVLGVEARLVRFDRRHRRPCNPAIVGDSGAHTAFADGYPALVVGQATLADLNARLAAQGCPALPMDRFRPNIVVGGLDPGAEDHVETLTAGEVVLKLVKPCTRCRITTTDQETAALGDEPLPTLAGYRHDARWGGVTFGMNAIVVAGEGAPLAIGATAQVAYRFDDRG